MLYSIHDWRNSMNIRIYRTYMTSHCQITQLAMITAHTITLNINEIYFIMHYNCTYITYRLRTQVIMQELHQVVI